jgi:hypothetical protein
MSATAEEQSLSPAEAAAVRQQLQCLVSDELLRTSKRSVAFLRYIVEETLLGHGDDLKERTVGVNVFGKALTYDTNLDHVVRTAASELRRRLALYYAKEEHRDELRIMLVPGSYVPQFRLPGRQGDAEPVRQDSLPELQPAHADHPLGVGPEGRHAAAHPPLWITRRVLLWVLAFLVVAAAAVAGRSWRHTPTPQETFWNPLVDTSGPVLIAVGDVPDGPPVAASGDVNSLSISPANPGPPSVPFADAVTIARVTGILASLGKDSLIRRENSSSFADLRERPVVLIGAFNNEWSLQLTRNLRFSLAMDPGRHLLYIRDREHADSRAWSWSTGPHPGERDRASSTQLHDYALITRILDSETGHDVVVMGGLYAYGTQAAGEFLASRDLDHLGRGVLLDTTHKTLQVVLDTVVTDGTPGPPHVVAVAVE